MTTHTTDHQPSPHFEYVSGSVASFGGIAEPKSPEYMAGIDRSIKPELRPGTRTCQCSQCNRFFASPAAFDRHQLWGAEGRIKCLGEKQMRSIGMIANEHGVWLYGTATKHMKR